MYITYFDYGLLRLPNRDTELMSGATGQQVMIAPSVGPYPAARMSRNPSLFARNIEIDRSLFSPL